ncbi:MAG: hypothetical protein MR430_09670 [Lachnospiraceae bacterium]|nr:hypothetical protein [Lachnospiraceae bacterium]
MFNRKKILALALAGTLLLQTSLVVGAAPLETSGNGLAGIAQAISAKQVNVKEDAGELQVR